MPVLKFSKPSGVPANLWTVFHDRILMPYVSRHASRLRGGMTYQDIDFLTAELNKLSSKGMAGLSAGEVYGPPSPSPVQEKPWYENLITSVAAAVPKVADSLVQLKLGQQAIKAAATAPVPATVPILPKIGDESSWLTYILLGGVVLVGGYFVAKKMKWL